MNKSSPLTGLRIILSLLLALTTVSCAGLGGDSDKKKAENFKAAVDAFNTSFRWEDFKTASAFIVPEKKEKYWTAVDLFKGKIRLFDFQIRETYLDEQNLTGTAIIYFQYYRTDAPNLKTVNFTQKWAYSEKDKLWKVTKSGFQAFTDSDIDI